MFDEIFSFFGAFQVVCFILLVRFIIKSIGTYVTPQLRREVVRKDERFKNLKKEKQRTLKAHEDSLEKTEQETEHAKLLLKKVKVWHEVVQQKFNHHEKERSFSQDRVKNYLEEQARLLSLDHAKREIIPEAVQETEKELELLFKNKEERQAFLEKVIRKMDKGV